MRPPVFSPNTVPRSYITLNSTYLPLTPHHDTEGLGTKTRTSPTRHITSPADLLPSLLLLREGVALVALHYGRVGWHHGLQSGLGELQQLLGGPVVEVVEEYPPQATRLIAVRNDKIFVCPLLEPGVEERVGEVAHALECLVEVRYILLI